MHSVLLYYLCLVLLVLAMSAAWGATLFALPGNWVIVGLAAVFAIFFPAGADHGLRWSAVGVAAGLAVVGEVIELSAGAAGARRAGASRRSAIYALFGTVVGSILGAMVTIPIPVIGPIIGALGGGALGAFAGAFIGETAIGRDMPQSVAAGKGALVGRLVGAVGKLGIGAVMIVIIVIGAIFEILQRYVAQFLRAAGFMPDFGAPIGMGAPIRVAVLNGAPGELEDRRRKAGGS